MSSVPNATRTWKDVVSLNGEQIKPWHEYTQMQQLGMAVK